MENCGHWVNACLAQCLDSVLNVKAVVAAPYEPSDGTFSSTNVQTGHCQKQSHRHQEYYHGQTKKLNSELNSQCILAASEVQSVKYLDCNVSGYQEWRGILISQMGLVSHSSGAGRSGGRTIRGHRRKNINPIQVINVNLGFSKNLASLLRKRVKFKLVLSFCRRSEINITFCHLIKLQIV